MKNIFKALFLTLALAFVFSSCAKWEDYNTNPYGVTDEMLAADYNNIGAYYPQIMQSVYYNYRNSNWIFQLVQNLTADLWCGYMANAAAFNGNANTGNLNMYDSWIAEEWSVTYKRVMSPIFNSIAPQADNDEYRHFYAPALIMKVLAMSRLTEAYGPCIYSKYGQSATGGNFESQQDTYNAFFNDLDVAVDALDGFIKYTGSNISGSFKKFDDWCDGDFAKWIRFANTIRLRLAMHLQKVDEGKAKAEFAKAMNNPYGLLNGKSDVVTMHASTWNHPLYTLGQGWQNCYVGAVMQTFLVGYDDPRLPKYFLEATNEKCVAEGQKWAGMRMGNDSPDGTYYQGYSLANFNKTDPAIIMQPAEVSFLKAEAALRGWISGSAKDYYEEGVRASLDYYGLAGEADKYLASDAIPTKYTNPVNHAWDIDANNFLSPKWNDGDSNETKLERIIDQKYLAIFPDGYEAWLDLRRTGYPHQFPVILNASSGEAKMADGDIVRRMPYPQSVASSDAAGYQQAIGFLGGKDIPLTRTWWDVDKPNF